MPGGETRSGPVTAGDDARSRGEGTAARAAYRRAVAMGLVTRGLAHFQAGRLPQAGAAWEEALTFDSGCAQALQDLGSLAALEERFGDALRWYRAAAQAGTRSAELDDNLAHTVEALAWQAKVGPLEAKALRSPGDAGPQVAAGNAEWYVGRTQAAEAAYRRATQAEPDNVRALTNLGSALVQQGRLREAIPVYERAVRTNPKYAGAMVNLATVWLMLGDRKRALDWARRTLEADPKEPRALQMVKDLAP
jgi:tetratricopeptide (TPR) repeat protein